VPALDPRLQGPFTDVFLRMANDARATGRQYRAGVSEVDWIEDFHALVAENLAADLQQRVHGEGMTLSVSVGTALVHGRPFQVKPTWAHRPSPTVEIGDLLMVGERHDTTGLVERQALLLQMKVGPVALRSALVSGPTRQAALYAEWPPFTWSDATTLNGLPGPFPRTPAPGPCDAAQFGIVPNHRAGVGTFDALPLMPGPRFAPARQLAGEMARVLRLDLGVDATPKPSSGWSRIVQDILEVAPAKTFRSNATPSKTAATTRHRADGGARRGRFLVIVVGYGPPGVLD
jgi:hypothetical protein